MPSSSDKQSRDLFQPCGTGGRARGRLGCWRGDRLDAGSSIGRYDRFKRLDGLEYAEFKFIRPVVAGGVLLPERLLIRGFHFRCHGVRLGQRYNRELGQLGLGARDFGFSAHIDERDIGCIWFRRTLGRLGLR